MESWFHLIERECLPRVEGGVDYSTDRRFVLVRFADPRDDRYLLWTSGFSAWSWRASRSYFPAELELYHRYQEKWIRGKCLITSGRLSRRTIMAFEEEINAFFEQHIAEHINPRRTLVIEKGQP